MSVNAHGNTLQFVHGDTIKSTKDSVIIRIYSMPQDSADLSETTDSTSTEVDSILINNNDSVSAEENQKPNVPSDFLRQYSSAIVLNQHNMSSWNIPGGNYSGISRIKDDRYVVVTDKPKQNGFYEFQISLSPTGEVASMKNLGFRSDSTNYSLRDSEGIVFVPSTNTVFISAESDQQILEYDLEGHPTGRKLLIPECYSNSNISSNYGFEALAYSPSTHLFWTTTENSLRSDAAASSPSNQTPALLRIQSFTEDLRPSKQYAYQTDAPMTSSTKYKVYCFGVPEITALDNGELLILEREFWVSQTYLSSFVRNKLYIVNPDITVPITSNDNIANLPQNSYLQKRFLTSFNTNISNLANYEGMCLGPTLEDGTQTLILVSDSQDNYGNAFYRLKDWIRVILLK